MDVSLLCCARVRGDELKGSALLLLRCCVGVDAGRFGGRPGQVGTICNVTRNNSATRKEMDATKRESGGVWEEELQRGDGDGDDAGGSQHWTHGETSDEDADDECADDDNTDEDDNMVEDNNSDEEENTDDDVLSDALEALKGWNPQSVFGSSPSSPPASLPPLSFENESHPALQSHQQKLLQREQREQGASWHSHHSSHLQESHLQHPFTEQPVLDNWLGGDGLLLHTGHEEASAFQRIHASGDVDTAHMNRMFRPRNATEAMLRQRYPLPWEQPLYERFFVQRGSLSSRSSTTIADIELPEVCLVCAVLCLLTLLSSLISC